MKLKLALIVFCIGVVSMFLLTWFFVLRYEFIDQDEKHIKELKKILKQDENRRKEDEKII